MIYLPQTHRLFRVNNLASKSIFQQSVSFQERLTVFWGKSYERYTKKNHKIMDLADYFLILP